MRNANDKVVCMSSDAQIDYESLVQDAMRGVLKAILQRVAKSGLPGEHHFYISFNTRAQGVGLSKRLKERYPEEMTVVLQHRFWDLVVHDDRFEVKLTFDSIPERLVVPFAAVKVFVDPSVRFGHQFEDPQTAEDAGEFAEPNSPGDVTTLTARGRKGEKKRPATTRKPRGERVRDGQQDAAEAAATAEPAEFAPSSKRSSSAVPSPVASAEDVPSVDRGAKVVSLDKFRKK